MNPLHKNRDVTKIFVFDKNKITIDELNNKVQIVIDYYNKCHFKFEYPNAISCDRHNFKELFRQPILFNYEEYIEFWKNSWSNFQYTIYLINEDKKLKIFYYLIKDLFYDCENNTEVEYRRFNIILKALPCIISHSDSILKRYFTKTALKKIDSQYESLTDLIYTIEYDLEQERIFIDKAEELIKYINEKIYRIVDDVYEYLENMFDSRKKHNIPKWWKIPVDDTLKPIKDLENTLLLVTNYNGSFTNGFMDVFKNHFDDFKYILYSARKEDDYNYPKYIEYVNWNR